MLGGLIGGALGGLVDGGIQSYFNSKSASDQMAFQERMANTQYQRAAKDLEKAGLNRVLALGNPAAAPSGAGWSVSDPNITGKSVQVATAKAAIERQREETVLLRDQQELTRAQADKTRAEAANLPFQGQHLISQIEANQAGIGQTNAQVERISEEIKRIVAETRLTNANASEAEVRKILYEKAKPYIEQLLNWLPKADAKSAAGARETASGFLSDLMSGIHDWWERSKTPERQREVNERIWRGRR